MQEPTHTKIATASRKGKEREGAQPDIADRIIALRRKQATAAPRERPDRPSQPSTSSPRLSTARPSSPRKSYAPPVSHPNIIVSEASPSHMEADADDFSRRLKISPHSPRAAHARPAANGSPGKLYNPNSDPIRRPVISAEPDAMSDAASSSHSPRAMPSRAQQPAQTSRGAPDSHRQLFDPRKHDAVLFSAQNRHHAPSAPPTNSPNAGRPTPTPKSSGDWVSASSTSSASYAQSTISSNFTLSSATDSSSASSALFDSSNPAGRRSEDSASSANAFSRKLKEVYRTISGLESKLLGNDRDRERGDDGERAAQRGVLIKGRPANSGAARDATDEEGESERWRKLVAGHQQLAESIREMLALTLAPTVPASLKNIPQKYNLIIRLWSHAFYHLLESLRHAARPPTSSLVALEYLQQFLNYAYVFYGGLIEERNFAQYRSAFLEALGDLSRYWMAVSALLEGTHTSSNTLTASAVATNNLLSSNTPRPSSPNPPATDLPSAAVSPTPARIDDSPQSSEAEMPLGADAVAGAAAAHMHNIPSVGQEAARLMELDSDKERWRQVAKDWFARGLAITPNSGKLQHHLGLLCRDKDGTDEELRGVYHFVKSMVAFHPFSTARESVLAMWSPAAQARRQAPDARLTELFVLLHGMLFTNIQLDDFKRVLERFQEKLEIGDGEQVEEREWIMMALINIGSLLEYGRQTAVLRRVSGIETRSVGGPSLSPTLPTGVTAGRIKVLMAKRLDGDTSRMDIDDEDGEGRQGASETPDGSTPTAQEPELPATLKHAMQLTFMMLSHTLRHPLRRPSEYATPTLNPYNTIMLTFLATVLREPSARSALERSIPWEELAAFLTTIPRRDVLREHQKASAESGLLLTSGCTPLPEDWCVRGMGWGGKKVFERGFWTKDADAAGEERNVEVEVLDRVEAPESAMEDVMEDDGDERRASDQSPEKRRWVRLARAGLRIARDVHGFKFAPASPAEGRPAWKVEGALADKVARWKEEKRIEREAEAQRLRGTRWEDDSMEVDDDEDMRVDGESTEDEGDSEEIRKLKARRQYLQTLLETGQREPRRRPRGPRKADAGRPSLRLVPGYSVLVVDTNILLSSLAEFSALVESGRWTVVVPLPVIMELDSQAHGNATPLGQAAAAALKYITASIRTHSASLKVQTSRGNYLTNLNVRTEQVDFSSNTWERNMDDLILRAALWQDEHWADRSSMLKADATKDTAGAAKVVLLSFDRLLRLKARSRQLDAASEQELAAILAHGT
ncbi:hypothetical protein DICSQDRAFT_77263 [Dichomitus squalens LYAD-421 SS1]|uniref:uncharacterized protein n=1 Tax=Dichomitus squalens (strain LYAD-421) TaxID=732165 RepID=UPI0004411DE6|nr:uncharacterized protein DICSQDRAFT_77263 [Dichomitus squalens LYAD-421 SS1]EJF65625.1 hypothetical protein DICSQDRAFT_77263 [Dichomitus squalens LYAD-421 SS1]